MLIGKSQNFETQFTMFVVVSGEPAGTTASYVTCRAGYRTIIFEEDKAIGSPVQCGEGVSDYAFRNFGLGTTGL